MKEHDSSSVDRPTGIPGKQRVRDWMSERVISSTPPPNPEEIRRQLGWWLVQDNYAVLPNLG